MSAIDASMGVTRDEVVEAYRTILGREPENEEVIRQAMGFGDAATMYRSFLGSEEFAQRVGGGKRPGLAVGRYMVAPSIDVDIDCTDEQLQAMFDRIAAAWRAFGESEPHWSVLSTEAFLQDRLADNIDRFFETGRGEIKVLLRFLARAGLPMKVGRAMDFGCGVGRLSFGLSPYADRVVGVDISPPHLRLGERHAVELGIANVDFEAIASVGDLDRYAGFDLIVSRIVLQHNPPPVMAALFARLLAALAPGGCAIIQMPTYIEGQRFDAATYLAEEQPQMEMNYLPQPVIHRIIAEAGCHLLEMREDGAIGDLPGVSHIFFVRKT